jgi:CO/xanthine dehydrogenase Mo-binding subunit
MIYVPKLDHGDYAETLEALVNHPAYKTPLGPNQRRGVASDYWFNGGGESSDSVQVNEDGTAIIATGSLDIGRLARLDGAHGAETLGIDYHQIRSDPLDRRGQVVSLLHSCDRRARASPSGPAWRSSSEQEGCRMNSAPGRRCDVDVEVDPETGEVTILRSVAAQDVGCAIHPSSVESQIQGGVAQGISWALNEEVHIRL